MTTWMDAIKLRSLIERAHGDRDGYVENVGHYQAILNLYDSHIALAETVKDVTEALAKQERVNEQMALTISELRKVSGMLTERLTGQRIEEN